MSNVNEKPTPIKLSQPFNLDFDKETNIDRDMCDIKLSEHESGRPGNYQLSGYDPLIQQTDLYSNNMGEIMHFQKTYRDTRNRPDNENDLIYADMTNKRQINQLFTRPYLGSYSGAGQRSIGGNGKNLESFLQQGILTNPKQKSCQVTRGTSLYRYQCLPEFGNPQREQHIIPPPINVGGWVRGGDNTRDYVRRIDYYMRCSEK